MDHVDIEDGCSPDRLEPAPLMDQDAASNASKNHRYETLPMSRHLLQTADKQVFLWCRGVDSGAWELPCKGGKRPFLSRFH